MGQEDYVYVLHDGDPEEVTSPCPGEGTPGFLGPLLGVTPPVAGGTALVGFCGDQGEGNVQVTTRRSTDGGHTWTTTGTVVVVLTPSSVAVSATR